MIDKNYFSRQAATLLKFAKSIRDPDKAAALVDKAADMKSQIDHPPLTDESPLAPDIEPPSAM